MRTTHGYPGRTICSALLFEGGLSALESSRDIGDRRGTALLWGGAGRHAWALTQHWFPGPPRDGRGPGHLPGGLRRRRLLRDGLAPHRRDGGGVEAAPKPGGRGLV